MLAIVRDYAQKFPADISKRILQAANEVCEWSEVIEGNIRKFVVVCSQFLFVIFLLYVFSRVIFHNYIFSSFITLFIFLKIYDSFHLLIV
jgi:hypothetical protein